MRDCVGAQTKVGSDAAWEAISGEEQGNYYDGQLEGGMPVYGEHEDVARNNNISVRLVF